MILELHMELKDVKPVVSRTIHIHRQATLRDLHETIQLLFGWWDTYPYEFRRFNCEEDEFKRLPKQIRSDLMTQVPLEDYFDKKGAQLHYEYGIRTCWQVHISLNKIKGSSLAHKSYPICIHANNEINEQLKHKQVAEYVPFGRQGPYTDDKLVDYLNEKITENMLQYSLKEKIDDRKNCWKRLEELTEQFYLHKPWQEITNQQIFVLYDRRFDEYLFCTVLGKENGLYGLSVYLGFNGLLSLHTSLTKHLSIEQLFHLHNNLLLQFEKHTNKTRPELRDGPFYSNEQVRAQFTSYEPGYYPWTINEKEAMMFIFALEQTLQLHEKVTLGFSIPNYIDEGKLLLLVKENKQTNMKEKYLTFEGMIKRVLPVQLTMPEHKLANLSKMRQRRNLTVEFSLQYIDVPIQRLKSKRPFLPLSSVIIKQHTKQMVYHNIYHSRLDYRLVQAEFFQMIRLLGALPGRILTDELTYHYLKPLLLVEDLPVEVQSKLKLTDDINENITHYLLTKSNVK